MKIALASVIASLLFASVGATEPVVDYFAASIRLFHSELGIQEMIVDQALDESEAIANVFPAGLEASEVWSLFHAIIERSGANFWVRIEEEALTLGRSYKGSDDVFNWWVIVELDNEIVTDAFILGMAGASSSSRPSRISESLAKEILSNKAVEVTPDCAPHF